VPSLDPALLLFANDAFYRAFSARDYSAMDELWAREHAVMCLHPGWPALYGREDVLGSWQRILANPQAPAIRAYGARVLSYPGVACVVCYEQLDGGVCVATNGFVLEDAAPRMVWHQSARCEAPPPNTDQAPAWQ
jgi:hypothetical protein